MKIPFTKVPRFVELPHLAGTTIIFIDDLIKNMSSVFPGYQIVDCFSIKISRDADFSLENEDQKDIAERILRKVRKRKIGAVTRFQYDKDMPDYFLNSARPMRLRRRSCSLGTIPQPGRPHEAAQPGGR